MSKTALAFLGFAFHDEPVLDKNGNPIVDKKGNPRTKTVVDRLADKKAFNENTKKCHAVMQRWIDTVRSKTGRDTIIYTFPKYWPTIGSPTQFSKHPLWIADYRILPSPNPRLPDGGGWLTWTMWQFAGSPQTTTQFVKGLGSGVDLNVFNGNTLDLLRFAFDGKLNIPVLPAQPSSP
jgi:GH25 family lysozyme M1 (1,4-beta-N-acetylmuramidase)